ncbi:hypothetical protein DCAR_0933421 [Daucus carota subsp. sativus]|uniref:C2 domain-containing protein n=1 Tax=Daucus carota subsp. sativus TaxID=79200 RepID=A0AAF0XTA7_DAUCS|nr:hypothetical protein DCAR_0933421 [Daucus carota subsp. sativus]
MASGIHGHVLEVTVVGCTKLKDTEWISRQDPYVCLEYASSKFRTRTCKDGGKNPTFQEKFVFTLIEGLRELSVVVWNSNTITYDELIGSTKVQLQKVLSQGYDDSPWTLNTKTGRYAGEVRLIMHYANANQPKTYAPSAPPYAAPSVLSDYAYSRPTSYPAPPSSTPPYPQPSSSPYPPPSSASPYLPSLSTYPYPPPSSASLYPLPSSASLYPPPSSSSPYPPSKSAALYPPQASAYPNPSNISHQHDSAPYPPQPYPPPSVYPPQPYPSPSVYPPQPYPPPAQSSSQYPPDPSYTGTYPPPY